MSDYISRADAIEAVAEEWLSEASAESPYVNDDDIGAYRTLAENLFKDIPSADTHEIHTETHGVCLISKDGAIADLEELAERYNGTVTADGVDLAIDRIKALPSADAVHGEWVCKEREYNDCDGHYAYYWYECSVCGARPPKDTWKNEWHSDFCPSCGAIMKGGAE